MNDDLNSRFHPDHLADLRKSGLSDKTILEAVIKSVRPADINKELGFNIPGLQSMYEIPYSSDHKRYRAFYEAGKEFYADDKRKPKYLQRKGSGNRLYISKCVQSILSDSSIPLYISEGEKKALKDCQEGLHCVGLSGLWNWSNGNKELIPDFDLIDFTGRTVHIVPDSDWLQPNKHGYGKNLKQAVYGLAEKLKGRGAKVFIALLPQEGGYKIGFDDYLCKYSAKDVIPISTIEEIEQMIKGKKGNKTKRRKGEDEEEKKSQAKMLIEIASGYKLFHDDTKEGYAFVNKVAIKIRGSQFK